MSGTILVVDDDADIHALLDVRLQPDGLVLYHARDAKEGLRIAQELRPELVLLDIDMPGTDGFELCRQLKSEPLTAPIPVIFLSAASAVYDKVRGFASGAVDYVTKPFDATELSARVGAALRTKRYQDTLAARSEVDALTCLWNRGYFDRRLRDELLAFRRYHRKVSLVLLDIDHFKAINDTYGHPFGDRVIEAVAKLLRAAARETDASCRYGGEEFALILTETPRAGGVLMAERLRRQIEDLRLWAADGKIVTVTASFGVAEAREAPDVSPSEAIIRAADESLYEAKRGGRNRVAAGLAVERTRADLNAADPPGALRS